MFFAVQLLALLGCRSVFLTPVIFYTRASAYARIRVRALHTGGVDLSKVRQAIAAGAVATALVITLGFSLISPTPAHAAGSDNLNFQARLEGSNGAIANDGNYNVEFKLYNVVTGGTALWTETRLNSAGNGVRVENGYLTVNLGSITAFPSNIAWDQNMYVTMNIGGTSTGAPTYDGEMTPRLKLTAVPYAFQAKFATSLQASNGANLGTLSFTAPTANNSILLPDASGTVCLNNAVACGFASASGSNAYIQNGTGLQGNANFNVQTTSTTAITATLQALTGQTANLLRFENAAGTAALSGFNSSGQLFYQSGSFTGTLVQDTIAQNTTYHLPDPGAATADICLSTGNCAGAGGAITGSGTNNYVARFNGTSSINASTLLYDNNSFIGINTTTNSGILSVVSANASQTGVFIQSAASATAPTLLVKGGATPGAGGSLLNFQDSTGALLATVTSDGSILTAGKTVIGSTTTPSGTVGQLTVVAAGGANIGGVVRAGSSQTGDLLQLQDSTGLVNGAFNATGAQLTLGRIAGSGTVTQGKLVLADGTTSNFGLTLQSATLTANATVTIPNAGGADTVCLLNLSNCTGTGGGITGAGTQNYIAKFDTFGGNHIGNASIFDNGSFVGVNTTTNSGLLSIQGASATQSSLFAAGAASATTPVAVIKGGATPGAGGDLLQLLDSTSSVVAKFDAAGNFTTAGTATIGAGLTVTAGGASITGGTSINTTGTANTSIGNSGGTLSLTSNGLNVTTAGAISGVSGYTQGSGNFSQAGAGSFSTGTGAISLNGTTSVTGSNPFSVGTGAVTLGNLGLGLVQSSVAGLLSSGVVDRNDANFFSTALTVANGGTGVGTLAANGILFGNGTSSIQATAAAANSVLITGAGNIPSLSQTLPSAVQGNITSTGALVAGSIGSTFGTISTASNISTTATLQGGTLNVGSSSQFQVNASGNLTTSGTATVQGSGGITVGVAGSTVGSIVLATNGGNTNTTTIRGQAAVGQSQVITIPASTATVDTICLFTLNNCAASGGITGSGTTNYVARFTGTNTIGTGLLYDNGTAFVGINTTTNSGTLSVTAVSTQTGLFVTGATSGTSPVAVIRSGGSTGDLIDLNNSSNTIVAKIDNAGNVFGTSFDATTSSALNIGTTNATSVNLKQNTVVTGTLTSSGALTVQGGGASIAGGLSLTSGNFSQTGAGTFSTGTGTVSLNGATSVTGTNTFNVGTGATSLGGSLAVTGSSTFSGLGTFNGGLTVATGSTFTNASSTLLTSKALGDSGASTVLGGATTTAANTVDVATTFDVTQTTAGKTLTLPNPTVTTSGRVVYVNSLAGNAAFTIYGVNITAGNSAGFIWNGTAWVATSTGASTASGVNSVGALNGGTANATGATITGTTIFLQSASSSFAGLVDTGTQTFSGAKTFSGALTVQGAGSFTAAGTGLSVTNNATIGGTLAVTGLATVGGTLGVTGATTLTGLLTANGGITDTGNFSQTGTGTFSTGTGTVTLNGATTINGNTSIAGTSTLTVGSGAVTLGNLGLGLVQSSAAGLLSSGAVDRNSASFFNTALTVANGGTGVGTLAANGILFGNGTSPVQATAAAANSVLVTDGANAPSLSQTLPVLVQGNITKTGALAAGSIASGFGTISTSNNISTTAIISGNVVNATGAGATLQLNGTSINTAGTLSNVAYLNQVNTFTAATNTFTGNLAIQGSGGVSVGLAGTTAGKIVIADISTNSNTTTIQATAPAGQSQVITIPATTAVGGNDTVCLLTLANCGTAGAILGSGTINYIAKFDTSGTHIGNASLYDNGSFVGLNTTINNGLLSVVGASAAQSSFFVQAAASATTAAAVIKGGATPATGGDLLQLQDSTGAVLAKVDKTGVVYASGFDATTAGPLNIGTTNANAINLKQNTVVTGTLISSGALTVQSGGAAITGASSIGGTFGVTGLTTLSGGATITGVVNINTTGTAATTIGNNGAAFSLASTGLNVTSAGIISGVTGYTQASGNFAISGAGTFSTGTGAVSLNGTTTISSGLVVQGVSGAIIGSTANNGLLNFLDGTADGFTGTIKLGAALGSSQNYILPATGGTFCIQNASACGFEATTGTDFIRNQTTQQASSNFNISGSGVIGTGLTITSGGETITAGDLAITAGNLTTAGVQRLSNSGALSNITSISTSGGYTQTGTNANTFSGASTFGASGTGLTVTNNATIGGTVQVTGLGTFNGGLSVTTGSTFTNASSTLLTALAISDKPTGGNIGTAATTVDVATTFNVNQTTAGQNLTIPAPTDATGGRLAYLNNVGTASFTLGSVTLAPGSSASYIWNGTTWIALTTGSSTSGVSVVGTIDTQTKSANGAVISGSSIFLQTADATNVGLVSIGAQTFAGAKTFSGAVTVQGAGSFTAAGTGLSVTNNATIGGTLGVTGATTLTGLLTANGGITVANNSNFSQTGTGTFSTGTGTVALNGATTINGNTSISGSNTFTTGTGAVALQGATTLTSSFSQTGVNTFSTGTGAVSLNGAVTAGTTLTVTGTTTLNGNTSVTGTNTLTVGTGATSLGGTLAVTGTSSFTGLGTFNGGVTVANNSNFSQTGTGTFSTGTGTVSLNGNTSVSGTNTFNVGTGATSLGGILGVTGATTLSSTSTHTGLATFNGGVTIATGNTFTNASSTLLTSKAIADHAAGGNIGTAATTVDVATTFDVTQTTASQTLSLPNPTVTTSGRVVYINSLAGNASFVMYGITITAGNSAGFIWNGTAWVATSTGASTVGVSVVGTIDTQAKSANGAVISGSSIFLQTADATNVGLVSIGAQTFAGAKTFSGAVTVQGAGSFTAAGTGLSVTNNATIGGTLGVTGVSTLTGGLNVGNANQFTINSTGAITAATGITSSGNISFSSLSANRAVFTDASNNLSSTGTSANLSGSLSDETGTGVAVFDTSPSFTNSILSNSTTFNLLNSTATTINFAGGATALSVGNGAGTTTINGNLTVATNKNFSLGTGAGTGTFTQNFSNSNASSAHSISVANTNTAAGVAIQGIDLSPTNISAASSGTNVLNVVNFNAGSALGGTDQTNGLNFASAVGYTNFIKTPTAVLSSAGTLTGLTGLSSSGSIVLSGLSSGLVQSTSGTLSAGAVDRNSATYFNTTLTIANGGTNGTATPTNGGIAYGNGSAYAFTSVGIAGQILQSNGAAAPSFVNATGANTCTDCLIQNPLTTARNTIAPTTNSVVGLTVKGTTGTAADVLDIYNSTATPSLQAFFDAAGALNVSQAIRATSNNGVDLGLSGTAFRTGYFGTSVLVPSVDTAVAGTLSLGTGTANAVNISRAGVATTVAGTLNSTGDFNVNTSKFQVTASNGNTTLAGLLTGQAGATFTGADVNLNAGATAASNFNTNINSGTSTGNIIIGNTATSLFSVESGGSVVNLFNGNTAHTIQLATGAGTESVTVGSLNAASTTTIQGGTGGSAVSIQSGTGGTVSIGSSGVANTVQIGNSSGNVTQTINVGNNTTGTTNINIGNTAAGSVTLQAGASGAINLNASNLNTNATTLNLFNTTATTLNIGGVATAISLGAATGTTTINNSLSVAGTGHIVGNLDVNTTKFTVNATSGNTAVGGTLGVTSTINAGGTITDTNTTTGLALTGILSGAATTSLLQLGSAIVGGVASGTYVSVNAPAASTADFINLQTNAVSKFRVDSAGTVHVGTGNDGLTSTCSSGQVLINAIHTGGITTGGTCSSPSSSVNLQNAYDNSGSANPQFQLTNTSGGIKIRDAASSTITKLFEIADSAGVDYLSVNTTGLTEAGIITVNGVGTSTIAGRLNLTLASGVGLAVTSDATIAGSLKVGGTNQFQVDNVGNTSIAGASFSVTSSGAPANSFAVSAGGVVTDTYASSSNNSIASNLNVTNSASGSGAITVNGLGIALTGTANAVGGANVINGLNFVGVTPIARNTFNGLNFGSGYDKLINNVNYSITGAGAVTQAAGLTINGGGASITGALTQTAGAISLNTTGATTTSIATGSNTGTIGIGNATAGAITLQSGSTIAIATTNFNVDTAGNTSTPGSLAVGTTSQFQVTSGGNVSTSGTLLLSGTSANQFKLSGVPAVAATSSLIQLGSVAITGGAAGGTYIGIRAPASSTADLLNFQDSAGTSQLQVSSTGAITTNGQLNVLSGGASISGAITGSTTINAGSAYKVGGSVGTTGQFLRSDGVTGFVASSLQATDGAGLFIQKTPTTTANNTIQSATATVVGLTIKGNSVAADTSDILDLYVAGGGTPIDYVSSTGVVNVGANIQPTANNTIDLGTTALNFRTGYFGTSLIAPSVTTLTQTAANGVNLGVQPGSSSFNGGTGGNLNLSGGNESGTTSTGGNVNIDGGTGTSTNGSVNIGGTNSRNITLGNANANTVDTFTAGAYGIKITNTGIGINTGAVTPAVDLAFGGDVARTISVQAQPTANTNGSGLNVQAGTGNGTGNGANLTLQGGAKGASGTTAGFVVAKANGTDGIAFQIQNNAAAFLFSANTATSVITIGNGGTQNFSATGSGDLFVSGAAGLSGLFLAGTVTNGASFDATTHELQLAGTARHAKAVVLAPEYAGAVLTGDGSNNIGTMTSDFCSNITAGLIINATGNCATGDQHNYYDWTGTAVADYDIYVRYQIPSDFSAFAASTAVGMNGWVTSTASADAVTLTMYKNGTSCNSVASATTSGAWTSGSFSTFGSCSIAANDIVTFQIHVNAGAANDRARAGEITVNYLSKY